MENNTTHTDIPRPLGFWLRAADRLISREFATAFENEGVTRREWMILNVLDGAIEAPGLATRIQRGGKRLRALEDRGWITATGGSWTLTDQGRAAKTHLSEAADAVRAKVAGAVSPEDFATTLATLEAISRGLGWDENERMPRGHRHGFGRRGFGPGFGHGRRTFVDGRTEFERHDRPGFRRPDCKQGHPHHRRGGDHAEHAYERGFDAGFARGAESRTA